MRLLRFIGLLLTLTVAIVCAHATTASSLSLHPTDWQSTIISIAPSTDAVAIDVLNGGEAIRLTAQPGHTALILGYRNEPYLRITADGEVQANLKSPTWWSNKSGTGSGSIPDSADPAAEPEWETINSSGSVAWHDHRLHAMPGVTSGADWTVLVNVDEKPVVIRGQLTKLPSHGPFVELILGLIAAGTIVFLGFRCSWNTALVATLLGAVGAVIVSIGGWTSTPSGFATSWYPLVASILALVLSLSCFVMRAASRRVRVAVMVGAVAALAWWVALNFASLTAVFLPNSFSAGIVRCTIGIVLGIAVGVAIVIVVSGGFTDEPTPTHAEVENGTASAP